MKFFFLIFLSFFINLSYAQIGIGTTSPNPSAKLDVNSSSKGFLLPRMNTIQRNAIQNPTAGLQIWCVDCLSNGSFQVFNGRYWTNLANVSNLTVPSAPLNVVASVLGNNQAILSFTSPINNGGSVIHNYNIIPKPGINSFNIVTSPMLIDGLIHGNTYTFNVTATNIIGNSLAAISNSITLAEDYNWNIMGNANTNYNYFLGNKNAQAFSVKTNQSKQFEIESDGTINFQNNTIENYCVGIINKNESYTLLDQDNGKILTFNSSNPIMLTIPTGLPVGFHVSILQTGIGQIEFIASNGVLLNNLNNVFSTVDTYSMASIMSYANNALLLSGDLD